MRVEYIGPFLAVEVPSLGGVVQHGVPVDVPDDIGAALVKQATWEQRETAAESAAERAEIERLAAEQAEAERLAAKQEAPPQTEKPAQQPKPSTRQTAARKEQS